MTTTTMNRRRITIAATAMAAVIGLGAGLTAGCSSNDDDTAPDPSVSLGTDTPLGGPSNPANTSTSTLSTSDDAVSQAESALKRYISVYNDVNTGKEQNIDALNQVAGDPLLKSARGDIIVRRSKGIKTTGGLKVLSMKVVRNEVPESGQADIEIVTCIDLSTYKSVLPDGSSGLISNARKEIKRQWWVRNSEWPDDTKWRVIGQSTKANTPCDD